jgi:hypothetical protein
MILADDVARELDALDPPQRALLCCIYKTADRDKLAATIAAETAQAIRGGLFTRERGREAVARLVALHLELCIDDLESHYFAETP